MKNVTEKGMGHELLWWQQSLLESKSHLGNPVVVSVPSHGESLEPSHGEGLEQKIQALWKTAWRVLKKLKTKPAIALAGIYPKDTKMLIRRGTCTPMFKEALSMIAKLWKEPKCPSTDEWIKKIWGVCVCVCVCVWWNTTQRWKRMKSCHLQHHRWNLRVLC